MERSTLELSKFPSGKIVFGFHTGAERARSVTSQITRNELFVLNKRRHYYTFLVHLDEEARNRKRVASRNPNADPSAPCVYAAVTRSTPPETIGALRRFFKSGSLAGKYGLNVGSKTIKRHPKREGALARQDRLVNKYRAQGWTVTNPDAPQTYSVYVVELADTSKPDNEISYYVGQTSLTPAQRFESHRQGGVLANNKVERYGTRLRQDLVGDTELVSELESLRLERQLFEKLKLQGHRVYGGH